MKKDTQTINDNLDDATVNAVLPVDEVKVSIDEVKVSTNQETETIIDEAQVETTANPDTITKKPSETEEKKVEKVDEESDKSEDNSIDEEDTEEPTAEPIDNNPNARWFVVHTYSGHEQKVAITLKQRAASLGMSDKILDIMVPTQDKIEIKEGKKSTIKEKIFPGYILIRMELDDESWLAVRSTQGVTSFVGIGNKPTPLPEAEVEVIKKYMSMEAPRFKAKFSIGEAIRISDGPFAEFLGTISEIDEEKGKLKVLVSIFGRETPVELDFLQINRL